MIIEVAGSVVVSCILAVLAKAWSKVRAYRFERACSVAGTFISEYRARHSKAPGMTRAITRLTQQGHEFRGVTTELHSTRTWQVKGHIDPQGFLRGTYASVEEPNRSIGNFLLAINSGTSTLDGLWSHCDTTSREITGGQYSMRRCA